MFDDILGKKREDFFKKIDEIIDNYEKDQYQKIKELIENNCQDYIDGKNSILDIVNILLEKGKEYDYVLKNCKIKENK